MTVLKDEKNGEQADVRLVSCEVVGDTDEYGSEVEVAEVEISINDIVSFCRFEMNEDEHTLRHLLGRQGNDLYFKLYNSFENNPHYGISAGSELQEKIDDEIHRLVKAQVFQPEKVKVVESVHASTKHKHKRDSSPSI